MSDYQYVILNNRITPFDLDLDNNVVDTDIKKPSSLITCQLSKPLLIPPFSEVRVSYFHLSKNTESSNFCSLGITSPNMPVESTNIGSPYSSRLVKLIGFIGSNSERSSMDATDWFSCNNAHTISMTNIQFRIVRLADGREAQDRVLNPVPPGHDTNSDVVLSKNITIGLQFKVNHDKKRLSELYEKNESLRAELMTLKKDRNNIVNDVDNNASNNVLK